MGYMYVLVLLTDDSTNHCIDRKWGAFPFSRQLIVNCLQSLETIQVAKNNDRMTFITGAKLQANIFVLSCFVFMLCFVGEEVKVFGR